VKRISVVKPCSTCGSEFEVGDSGRGRKVVHCLLCRYVIGDRRWTNWMGLKRHPKMPRVLRPRNSDAKAVL
jgi:hypothetical protein